MNKSLLFFGLIVFKSLLINAQQYIPFKIQSQNKASLGIASGNDTEPFAGQIIGLGSATDITNAKNLGGNLALGSYMTFHGKHNLYVLYNAQASNTSDTSVVAKTYLFPDIGKRDFTIGYEYLASIWNKESLWSFLPFTEISWNRNIYTPEGLDPIKFYSLSVTLGTKFKIDKEFTMGEDQKSFGFSFHPYYQLICIDPKDFFNRNEMLNESSLPPTFHTVGGYFTLQVAEVGLFANYKRILNNLSDVKDGNLRDGVFVVGAVVGTSIFRFK